MRADLGLSWLVMAGQGTAATTLLNRCRVSYRLHAYLPDQRADSYGAEAAAALGLAPQRVFKTLITELDGRLMVAVVPVSAQLDLRALAAVLSAKKAKMAAPPDAERATGYVTGGISPLGHRKQLPVVIDISVRQFDTVFCSAGRRGLQLELAPDELVRATKATVAPIATTSERSHSAPAPESPPAVRCPAREEVHRHPRDRRPPGPGFMCLLGGR